MIWALVSARSIFTTPGAVFTTMTVALMVSSFTVAAMLTVPTLLALRVQVLPLPSTATTPESLELQVMS